MKKYYLIMAVMVLLGGSLAFAPKVANAFSLISVDFQYSPSLFSEADFKPGDTVTRWFTVTNESCEALPIDMKISPYTDADEMGKTFDAVVREQGQTTDLYSGTLWDLANMTSLSLDSSLVPLVPETFEMQVTFHPEAGNEYQNKTLNFDISITASSESGDQPVCTESVTPPGGGGGGGPPPTGIYPPTTPLLNPNNGQTAGENTGSQPNPQVLGEVTELPRTGLPIGLGVAGLALTGLLLPWLKRKRSN